MKREPLLRFASPLIAAVAVSIGFSAAARAGETYTTKNPTEVIITYHLLNAASSKPIKLPKDTPVLVLGDETAFGDAAIGQVTIHSDTIEGLLQWVGQSFFDGPVAGSNSLAGTEIISIDHMGKVQLQIETPDSFIINNSSGQAVTGTVKLIY